MVVYGFPIQDAADFLQTKKSTWEYRYDN